MQMVDNEGEEEEIEEFQSASQWTYLLLTVFRSSSQPSQYECVKLETLAIKGGLRCSVLTVGSE